ncbi:hypothetical protein [uncultured Gemmiger sp.]|uniref:hypothetical protein n=1 Tax=uncultured Gemmiger sp. TaxID=1623490 RepID=UPI0025E406A6|nr:hypothetical protein [uncultured Gemmiger sp.]
MKRYTAPQPGSHDTPDRGKIRRVYFQPESQHIQYDRLVGSCRFLLIQKGSFLRKPAEIRFEFQKGANN